MKKTLTLASLLLGMLSSGLSADCCCNPHVIDIYYVPFHIDGKINTSNTTYCVTQNLTYLGGEGMPAAAITVDPGVHDIVINFNGFELDLDPSVNGIDMLGTAGNRIEGVTIKDGVIKSITPSSANAAINATNFTDVTVENVRFVDERRGFRTASQTDINKNLTFRSCVFDLKGATGVSRRSISIATISGLLVEDCAFLPNDPNEIAAGGIGILLVNNTENVLIKRSVFEGQTRAAIAVQSLFIPDEGFFYSFPSTNVQIDECEFVGGSGASETTTISTLGVSNVHVTNSSFYATGNHLAQLTFESATDSSGQLATPIPSGLLVDNCTFTSSSEGAPDFPVIGYATLFAGLGGDLAETIGARDIIIRNSTFTHRGAAPRADDLLFAGVEGALIENCVFDSTATGRINGCQPTNTGGITQKSANIHLGGFVESSNQVDIVGGTFVKDVTIRGNQICGGAQVGIYAETCVGTTPNERITIEDNSITATEVGILLENTHSSTVIGNRVQGVNGSGCTTGVGIELAGALPYNAKAASKSNALLNNVVSNNNTGIILRCGAQGNFVKGNDVFNNDRCQILEEKKKSNKVTCNTIYSHTDKKYNCAEVDSCSESTSH